MKKKSELYNCDLIKYISVTDFQRQHIINLGQYKFMGDRLWLNN